MSDKAKQLNKIRTGAQRHTAPNVTSPSHGPKDTHKWPNEENVPPATGKHSDQRGKDYVEDPRGHQNAKEDPAAHDRAANPDITPTSVGTSPKDKPRRKDVKAKR